MKTRGFTLIELLVVIAIIGVLSSTVLASLNTARFKANDSATKENFHSLQIALQSYFADKGSMPANANPGYGDCSVPNASLASLVTGGYISKIPVSPNPAAPYCYYDYGKDNTTGAIFVAQLQAAAPTVTGLPGSCRTFASGTNWCDASSNTYYCICNTY